MQWMRWNENDALTERKAEKPDEKEKAQEEDDEEEEDRKERVVLISYDHIQGYYCR